MRQAAGMAPSASIASWTTSCYNYPMIAFLPLSEAHAILDQHYEEEAQRGEYEAELGSSYYYGAACRDSWLASSLARQRMAELREDFDQSEDAPLYYARLEAAQFMAGAITQDMNVYNMDEFCDPLAFLPVNAVVIPEFYPDPADAPETPSRPNLFSVGPVNSDDIPF